MQYYKIQYHKKDEHPSNWYDYESLFTRYETKSEAYETLLLCMQQKLVGFLHPEVDQFRIMFVNEEEVYTTWSFNAQSGR